MRRLIRARRQTMLLLLGGLLATALALGVVGIGWQVASGPLRPAPLVSRPPVGSRPEPPDSRPYETLPGPTGHLAEGQGPSALVGQVGGDQQSVSRAAKAAAPAPGVGAAAGAGAPASTPPWDRMVIRTAALSLWVENVEAALARVREIAGASNGFVSASTSRLERAGEQERMVANVTIQVRAEAFDATVQALRQIAIKVEGEQGTSQDITQEYVDLDSSLRNLLAAEAAIIGLMDKAQRMEDVLTLHRELTNLRGQIERIQGRKRFLERRSEMATITVNLRLPPVENGRPVVRGKTWSPLGATQRGWEASLVLLRGAADVALAVLAFSWWLVPPVALGLYWWRLRRGQQPLAPPLPAEGRG